jgi:hypothetical protein
VLDVHSQVLDVPSQVLDAPPPSFTCSYLRMNI